MKKLFSMFFILAMLSAFATEGRLAGFFAPFWVVDDSSSVLYLPNNITQYSNSAQLERLADASYYGGFNFSLNSKLFMALYLGGPSYPVLNNIWVEPAGKSTVGIYSTSGTGINNLIHLILSMKLTDSFIVGLLFNYNYGNMDTTNESITTPVADGDAKLGVKNHGSELNFKLNFTVKDLAFFNVVDAGFRFGIPSYKYSTLGEVYDTGAWHDAANFNGKMNGAIYMGFWTLFKTNILDLFFTFNHFGLSHDLDFKLDTNYDDILDTHFTDETDQGISEFYIGLSKTLKSEKLLVYFTSYFYSLTSKWEGMDYNNLSNKDVYAEYNYKTNNTYLNFLTGIEYNMKNWLTLRGGLQAKCLLNGSTTINDPTWAGNQIVSTIDSETKYSTPYGLSIRIGSTFHIQKFDIDIAFDPTLLLNNIYFINGSSGSSVISASAIYRWR
ncbi:hypothetical protein J7L48_04475 [bacterium]|nr:hypothetical protein [bacterium]